MTDTPPRAQIVPHTMVHNGEAFDDEYAWLQHKEDPQVIGYVVAENDYAKQQLAHTRELQEQLYQEMRGRIKEDDSTAPVRHGDFFYYSRTEEGKQYRIFCRKRGSLDAPEEVLIDENLLAEGQAYCRVLHFEPSPDHALLAYGVDTTGSWEAELYVKDLASGALLSGPIYKTAWTIAWASDNRTLFSTRYDDAHRPYKVMRHTVGAAAADEGVVLHEPDDSYNLEVSRTRSGAYIVCTAKSHTTTEVSVLPADRPDSEPQLIEPRRHWIEYYVEHHGDQFLIRTNEDAENFRLMAAPVAAPGRKQWREIVPHRDDWLLEGVEAFKGYLALFERHAGLQQIRLSDPDGLSNSRYVAFPEPVYTVHAGSNPEFETRSLRLEYSSLVTPSSTVDYDVGAGAWQVVKQQEIPSGYDASQYVSERLWATAQDGARVPISIVYRKGFTRDGSHPLLLYAYGSYGFSMDPTFDTKRLSLLDRGYAYAIAHIRGGSELGRSWYEQGRLLNKLNTFTDFIASAEYLIGEGYTSAERLGILGASAGGLLMGAVTNLRPDLFKAVLAIVPFTNVVTAMLMPELPLTVPEWEQWGNPANPDELAYMRSYSPYDNVSGQAYPNIYVEAGLNDLQVPYWDPAKWVARLRARKTDDNQILMFTNMGAGHSGASGRYDNLREDARMYAFLIDKVGAYDEPE